MKNTRQEQIIQFDTVDGERENEETSLKDDEW